MGVPGMHAPLFLHFHIFCSAPIHFPTTRRHRHHSTATSCVGEAGENKVVSKQATNSLESQDHDRNDDWRFGWKSHYSGATSEDAYKMYALCRKEIR